MPGVETSFVAGPSARRDSFADDAEGFSNATSGGDDFDRVMQTTLAPHSQKPPARHFTRANENPASQKNSALNDTADSVVEGNSGKQTVGEKSGVETRGEKKDLSAASGNTVLDNSANSTLIDNSAARSAFLPLPLFLNLPNKMADVKNLAVTGQGLESSDEVIGKISSNFSPLTPVQMNSAKSGDIKSGAEKSLLLKELSPVSEKEFAAKTTLAESANKASTTDLAASQADEVAANLKAEFTSVQAAKTSETKSGSVTAPSNAHQSAEAGTGVAITDLPMKNPQKTNKVAGLDVKVLPVDGNAAAREKNLPPVALPQARSANNNGSDWNFSFAGGNGQSPLATSTPTLNTVDLPSLADARMRAVERTHDMMALHAMRLVESKSDALSVIIKPSVGTELSLELRQRGGEVEARATLTRGDHELLSQHWPELQQRLEQRGVKLAPLGGEENFSASGHGNFQQQQPSPEEAAQQASAFAEFASVGLPGGASARLAPIHDGWESWA